MIEEVALEIPVVTPEAFIDLAHQPLDLKDRKICIAFPSGDYIPAAFHNMLTQLIVESAKFVQLGLTNTQSSRLATNRNLIVQNARQLGATDILWIDSDSIVPIHGLVKLLMHRKDIVCATTCRRKGNSREAVATPVDAYSIKQGQILVPMTYIGFPFMLTSMSVFDKMDEMGLAKDGSYFAEPPRWMVSDIGGDETLVGEDEYWCYLARKAGYEILCDMELSMEIGHAGLEVFYIQNPTDSHIATIDEAL